MRLARRPAKATRPQGLLPALRRLAQDQSGSMVIFALFLLVCMLMLVGFGIDIVNFEAKRVRLQSVLDRAVLAAADLDQRQDPEAVVRDWFAKAGVEGSLQSVEVSSSLNERTVTATASLSMNTLFMDMLGIGTLTVPASGTAREMVSDVEISLVLDISGSMGRDGKLPRLRRAAQEFTQTVFAGVRQDRLSVSVVPYASNVNLGPDLAAALGARSDVTSSFCLHIPTGAYGSTRLPGGGSPVHDAFFDYRGIGYGIEPNNRLNDILRGRASIERQCPTDARSEVLPFSSDERAVDWHIQYLQAGPAHRPENQTSIEMGARWGVALLDPSARGAAEALIARNRVSRSMRGRPLDYDASNTLKVMVLMTDGENTTSYALADSLLYDNSDVYLSGRQVLAEDQEYRDTDGDGAWHERFFDPAARHWTHDGGAGRLTWAGVFDRMTQADQAYYLRYLQYERPEYYYPWALGITPVTPATKNARLAQVCDAAKAQGILIFAVGFEVSDEAAGIMRDCASSDSHFYRVEGVQIESAFSTIASTINALRLVE
ncbi:pilus assembly protein [Pseudoroseicyclus aestuarii]|uniref:Flp pilus assembly protein TadG n=1 Tax=Pseudoroseicyclus aestuarii TaxID=1795041 RepID=A0A318SNR9_9RHOB|nr:pilus assembly protein [Pseudoroseicyclus aestuarii]PYE82336.1 Flp pilus assembly protein TadG [Pseudoroseicyclus aestuarii]